MVHQVGGRLHHGTPMASSMAVERIGEFVKEHLGTTVTTMLVDNGRAFIAPDDNITVVVLKVIDPAQASEHVA